MQLTVRRPDHLGPEEAESWLRHETLALLSVPGIDRLVVARLGSASGRWSADWDWLIELELDEAVEPASIVRDETVVALLGDLRLLGMRPTVSVLAEAWQADR